jgi:hypothetical protein
MTRVIINPQPSESDLTWDDVPPGTYFYARVGSRENSEQLYGRLWRDEELDDGYIEAFSVENPSDTYTWDRKRVIIFITRVVKKMTVVTE